MKYNYKVYLSGPITGLTVEQAIGWTDYAKDKLWDDYSIVGYRPLRGKNNLPNEKELSAMGYEESPISTAKGIVGRDRYDVESCDVILVNLLGAKRVSIGTVFEIAWAYSLHKPIVLVMEKTGNLHHHAFITETCTYWVNDLDYALELVDFVVNDRS